MFGFIKKAFSSGEEAAPPRRLRHPRDLRTGDIIAFRHLSQDELSGNRFEVSQINTYIYGDMAYPELVLKDAQNTIVYMMVEEEDGEEYLAISKKISKIQAIDILGDEGLSAVKAGRVGRKVSIPKPPANFETWMESSYRKVDNNVKGAFVRGDARYLTDDELKKQERFSSHILEDFHGDYALELEIYYTGEQELCVTVYHGVSEIEDMWPGSATA